MDSQNVYDLKSVKLPYLSTGMLKLFVPLVEGPLSGLVIPSLFENAGFNWLRKQQLDEYPTYLPIHYTGKVQGQSATVEKEQWPAQAPLGKGFHFPGIHDFAKAYEQGDTTPVEIATKILD